MPGKALLPVIALLLAATGCHQLDDERIPHLPVNIAIDNQGLWNTFGVSGFGEWREFILATGIRLPSGFPYSYNSATGFGGVLLVSGQNPFTGDIGPLAYDLSCPVEKSPDIRVAFDPETLEAFCAVCGSRYDVIETGGTPLSGPAQAMKYALTSYQCLATINGGYIIRD